MILLNFDVGYDVPLPWLIDGRLSWKIWGCVSCANKHGNRTVNADRPIEFGEFITAKFYYQRNPESASFLVALSMVQWWRISPRTSSSRRSSTSWSFFAMHLVCRNSTRNHSACRRFIMDMFTFVERFLPDSPHGECHVSSFPDQIEQHSLLRCNKSQAQVWYRPKVSLIIDLEWRFRIKIV